MTLAHDVAGSGPPVVLLHAGVADRRMWEPQWAALADAHTAVRCDLRGFGESPTSRASYTDAGDVLALMDHLGMAEAAMVGASYGGQVALEVATLAPQRVSRLVLLSPAYDVLPRTADVEGFAAREDELLEAGDVDAATDLNVRTWVGPEADEATREAVRTWQRRAFDLQLADPDAGGERVDIDPSVVRAPTLVVHGGQDLAWFAAVAAHLADALPQARRLELEWAGHLPSLERPGAVTDLLLGALAPTGGP